MNHTDKFTIGEMQEMQRALQEKYKDKWEPICAEVGQNKLLWMIGEIGECRFVNDVLHIRERKENMFRGEPVERSHRKIIIISLSNS